MKEEKERMMIVTSMSLKITTYIGTDPLNVLEMKKGKKNF